MSKDFLRERIVKLKALLEAHDAAYLKTITAGVMSYTLDSGQDRITGTRYSLAESQRVTEGLTNQIVMLEARLTGSHVSTMIPPC